MTTVRQSFDELKPGTLIKVKEWKVWPVIVYTLPGNCLLVKNNRVETPISYEQYEYSIMDSLRYVAIRLPLEKLTVGMQIVCVGNDGSMPLRFKTGDRLCLENIFRDIDVYVSYESEYNYSLLTVADAAELEDDPVRKLAYMILSGDPMALDAAKDVLRC